MSFLILTELKLLRKLKLNLKMTVEINGNLLF